MTTNERPPMSFAILAYKQERFIGEAVAGALAQTYSPLEIILSDDHSTDRTFEVMQEIAGAYRGPHQLVLNQTLHNRGICAHVNRIVELAKGEMIVGSAGDDISLPERTELCYRAWSDSGRRSASIWSDYVPIDESGEVVGEGALRSDGDAHARFKHLQARAIRVAGWRAEVAFGCTQAWSTEIFRFIREVPAWT